MGWPSFLNRLNLALVAGVTSVSFAAIFIRLADAPPLVIASYRLTLGAILTGGLLSLSWLRGGHQAIGGLRWRDLPYLAVSSLSLALHFWVWTLSLEYTSVASSVVLVTTSPFIVGGASRLLFGEPFHRTTVVGISVGVLGGMVIAWGDSGGGERLWGDLLAFLGAIAVTGYILVGRRLRRHVPALSYSTAVYAGTAVLLLVLTSLSGEAFTGYTWETYFWVVMLAVVPQVIGHSLLNWSLAHVTATAVAIAVMAEPVLSTLAAIPILGEWPPWTSVTGGLLILLGTYVALHYGVTRRGTGRMVREHPPGNLPA